MLPEFQDIQCSQWVLGLAAKAVTGDASREPESEKAPPEFPTSGGGWAEGKKQGKREQNVDSRCKGAEPAEVRVLPREGSIGSYQVLRLKNLDRMRGIMFGPSQALGEAKAVLLKLNVHTDNLGNRWHFSRFGVGPETAFPTSSKAVLVTTLWAPQPNTTTASKPDNPEFKPQLCCLTGV